MDARRASSVPAPAAQQPAATSSDGGGPPLTSLAAVEWTPRIVTAPAPHDGASTLFEQVLSLPLGRLAPLLDCFTTREARPLRILSRAAEAHAAAHPWADLSTPVRDLAKWRACFPVATAVKLSPRVAWTPPAVSYLASLTGLDASGVRETAFLYALLADDGVPPALALAAYNALSATGKPAPSKDATSALVAGLTPGLSSRVVEARLRLLDHDEPRVQRDVVAAGGIGRVIAVLWAYKTNLGVASAAAMLLLDLNVEPAYTLAVARAEPVAALLEAIESHPDAKVVTMPAFTLLSRLPLQVPSTADVMLSHGAPRVLLRVLSAHTDDLMASGTALLALQRLLEAAPARAAAALRAAPSTLPTLFSLLAAHPSAALPAALVMSVLADLDKDDDANAVGAALRAGGVRAVVAAAAASAHFSDALRFAVKLLLRGVAPINKNPRGPHSIDVTPLIEAGAVGTCLAALKTCPDAAQMTCGVLHMLLLGSTPDQTERVLSAHPLIAAVAGVLVEGASEGAVLYALGLLQTCSTAARGLAGRQLAEPSSVKALAATLDRVHGTGVALTLQLLRCAAEADAHAVASHALGALVGMREAAKHASDAHTIERVEQVLHACGTSNVTVVPLPAGMSPLLVEALRQALAELQEEMNSR